MDHLAAIFLRTVAHLVGLADDGDIANDRMKEAFAATTSIRTVVNASAIVQTEASVLRRWTGIAIGSATVPRARGDESVIGHRAPE